MAENVNQISNARFYWVCFCFFVSGVAGLIYQVAWTKSLGLVFGHTVYAVATVLAVFMGGLAVGSAVLGRWGERQTRPIVVYGWIEILIGITGLLSLPGLSGVRSLYLFAYHNLANSTLMLVGLRLVASFLVLFLPTFLMGGTLPILVRGVTRHSTEMGARLSRLYWINTTGAVAGALIAGFSLLPQIGLRKTTVIAAALNLVAGIVSLRIGGAWPAVAAADKDKPRSPRVGAAIPRFLLVGFAFVGATAMSYEIAWTRLLSVTVSSSTYAFTLMLATFLAGIALGSRLFEWWAARGREVSEATFGMTQTLTGVAAVLFLALFQQMPTILWGLVTATQKTFGGLVFAQFATCALAMLPTATMFGFNFPVVTMLIAKSVGSEDPDSNAIGRAYAANTVGAIVGAIIVGFWLVPRLGAFRVVAFTAAGNLLLAAYFAMRRVPRRMLELAGTLALSIIVVGAAWSGTLYDPAIANFSMITNRAMYPKTLRLDEIVNRSDLLFSEDGLNASVAVVRSDNFLGLRINGKTDASTGDQLTQMMLGHLGMLVHPAPKKILIIGFGSGMTAFAVTQYPEVEQIDCVEIEPAVIHAASYLETLNHGVVRNPRLHLIVDDARSFLFTTRNQYDLIISEPSNPWIAGVATLFTDEFYQQARTHLAPNGLLIQWVQSYALFPEDLRMVMGTLAHQFEQVTVWRGLQLDIILVAQSKAAPPVPLDRMNRLWSVGTLHDQYAVMGMGRPESLLAFHLLDDGDLRKLAADSPLNTDDLTQLEYHAPRAIFAGSAGSDNERMIAERRSRLLSASISIPDERAAYIAAAETLGALNDRGHEEIFLAALDKYPPAADIELLRGDWLAAVGRLDGAQQAFANARRLEPSSWNATLGLGEVMRLKGDYATAEQMFREVLAHDPKSVPALSSYAFLEKSRGNFEEAIEWQTKRIAAGAERSPSAMAFLAELLLRAGDNRGTAHVCVDILNTDPYNLDARRFLAEALRREKRWDDARGQLEIVVRYYPTADPAAYTSLAQSYRNLGRPQDAESILRKAQRVFEGDASKLAVVSAN
ncbi:MAG TPA: fused MFS/spermidine synthase [Candidatus Dormibacteraeota bacterium]|nr:fused MFS/spermidine synthase [Candidatus Dormibacteraeota bacterium]